MLRSSTMQQKTQIKNHSNKNSYVLYNKTWVRDFTKSIQPRDINNFLSSSDYDIIIKNEMKNASYNLASIDAETISYSKIIIVSDGYQFQKKQEILAKIPQDVIIIGVNRSLAKWDKKRRLDWYLVNNPYSECMTYFPKNGYYPRCIASIRTNPDFVEKYAGRSVVYRYQPVIDDKFNSNLFGKPLYYLDDYRNPICAAMSLAYHWKVDKLALFCCDDFFNEERPGSVKVNDLWMYPQHQISHDLIDGNAFWFAKNDIEIINYSNYDYKNIRKVQEDELISFFAVH